MNNLELVEQLRERVDISYEEARRVLEESNWDILEAVVALEQQGKVREAGQNTPSGADEKNNVQEMANGTDKKDEENEAMKEKINEEKRERRLRRMSIGSHIRRFFRVCLDNYFCVKKDERVIFKVPVIVMVLVLLWAWKPAAVLFIIGLFLNLRFSFEGPDNLKEANDFMENASHAACRVKEEFSGEAEEF